ncbi:MAG: [protein-PII] uridylyltransferase [Lysobacterales bacterium]
MESIDRAPFDVSALRERLSRAQFEDEAGFALGMPVEGLLAARCRRVELACIQAFEHEFALPIGVALIAIGGFGRGELFPHSDVDLLFLRGDDIDREGERAIERLLGLLWNLGLPVSHVTRSVAQCVEEAVNDLSSASALFEQRLLAGDTGLHQRMLAALAPEQLWPGLAFLDAKREEWRLRHARFNDSAFNLEPNIKEGPGGLRDLHTLLWVAGRAFGQPLIADWPAAGLCSVTDCERLGAARERLSSVRYGLHRAAQRKEERLVFDFQRSLAALFVATTGKQETRVVEQFMQGYFRAAADVRRISERLLASWRQRLTGADQLPATAIGDGLLLRAERLDAEPGELRPDQALAAFEAWLARPQLLGLAPDFDARLCDLAVRAEAGQWRTPAIAAAFLRILRHPGALTPVLEHLAACGLLGRIVPAFEQVTGRMQYDMFHVYTVDQHTLFVLRKLRWFADPGRAAQHPLAQDLYRRLRKPELLLLAGLFHDIAKGRGGDHSELGAVEARAFGIWLGLSSTDTDLVCWLVQEHLSMSVTAQKQDIGDPEVVHRFAARVGDWERLDYLYLLTVADIYATSPKLWNSWKSQLLADLYQATRYALRRGLEHPVHAAERIAETQAQALASLAAAGVDEARVRALWDEFPEESFLRFTAPQLVWQTTALLEHAGQDAPLVALCALGERGSSELLVYSPDRDGLFATITAVLDRLQLNVLDARIATSRLGHVLDVFQLLDAQGQALTDPEQQLDLVQRLRHELNKPVLELSPARRAWTRQQKHFHVPLRLEFGNDAGRARTGLALVCSDRPGLLAHVAEAFRACGVRVHDARIATFGERVEDFFELSDQRDQPLDDVQMRALRATLMHELESLRR